MIKRGKSGEGITSWTKAEDDEPLLCLACRRVIPSRQDLGEGNKCPFCGSCIPSDNLEKENSVSVV